jgi:hypothetical protein
MADADYPRATVKVLERDEDPMMKVVREVNEDEPQLVLDDPDAFAMVRAIEKHNCGIVFKDSVERVQYFKGRMSERRLDPKEFCIVLLNVDDRYGGPIANMLMPGHDWQAVRDQGLLPIARGMASRGALSDVVLSFDKEAGEKLRNMEGIVVLVVDRGVAEVFPA